MQGEGFDWSQWGRFDGRRRLRAQTEALRSFPEDSQHRRYRSFRHRLRLLQRLQIPRRHGSDDRVQHRPLQNGLRDVSRPRSEDRSFEEKKEVDQRHLQRSCYHGQDAQGHLSGRDRRGRELDEGCADVVYDRAGFHGHGFGFRGAARCEFLLQRVFVHEESGVASTGKVLDGHLFFLFLRKVFLTRLVLKLFLKILFFTMIEDAMSILVYLWICLFNKYLCVHIKSSLYLYIISVSFEKMGITTDLSFCVIYCRFQCMNCAKYWEIIVRHFW